MATKKMLQVKELLGSAEVRRQIRTARNEETAATRLKAAGARQGIKLSDRWISDLFEDVRLARMPFRLSEADLVAIRGRGDVASTAAKLCHSDSCGGGHKGCC